MPYLLSKDRYVYVISNRLSVNPLMSNFTLSSTAIQLVDYPASGGSYLAESESTLSSGLLSMVFGVWNQSGVALDRQNLLNLYMDRDEETGTDPALRFLIEAMPTDLAAGESSASFDLNYTLMRSTTTGVAGTADRTTSMTLTVKWVASSDGSELSLVIDGTADNLSSGEVNSEDGGQKVTATLDPPYIFSAYTFEFSDGELLGKVHTTSEGDLVLDYYLLQMIRKNEGLTADYELFTKQSASNMLDAEDYYIEIEGLPLASTSGESIDKVGVTVPIDDTPNHAPQWATISDQAMDEEAVLTLDLSSTDSDGGEITYSVEGGSASTVVATVDNESDQLSLSAVTDYYTTSPIEIAVKATDSSGGASVERFLLSVSDLNDAPTQVVLSNSMASIAEDTDTSSKVKVADIVVTDDSVGTNVLSLSGMDADDFEIENMVLYLKQGVSIDFESQSSYAVTVSVVDSTVSGSSAVTTEYVLNVTDVNEAPTALNVVSSIVDIDENSDTSARTQLATISVVDDALGSNDLSLSDETYFEIDSGVLYLKSGVALNHESFSQLSVTIQGEDSSVNGSTPVTEEYTLLVNDLNEAPTITSTAPQTVLSGTEAGTVFYTVSASDPDDGTNLQYSLSGTDESAFSVNSSGAISFNQAVDIAQQESYSIEVTVSDGALSDTESVTVSVIDQRDAYYWGDTGRLIPAVAAEDNGYSKTTTSSDHNAISLTDVLLSLKYYLGKTELSQYAASAADYNDDSSVNLTDVLLTLKSYLGKNQELPSWRFEETNVEGEVTLVGVLSGDVDGSWQSTS